MGISLLTDFFDGLLARKLNQETHFGAIFDPIVDKFVSICLYGYLMFENLLPSWFCLIVIIRSFSQFLSVPILIWWLKISFEVKPSRFAKWVTGISDVFLLMPFFVLPFMAIQFTHLLPIMIILALCELYLLFKYIPRLIAIATGKHTTFT